MWVYAYAFVGIFQVYARIRISLLSIRKQNEVRRVVLFLRLDIKVIFTKSNLEIEIPCRCLDAVPGDLVQEHGHGQGEAPQEEFNIKVKFEGSCRECQINANYYMCSNSITDLFPHTFYRKFVLQSLTLAT